MQLVHIDKLIVEERQRKYFAPDRIIELANSIHTHGLLHPIVCVRTSKGMKLVAGTPSSCYEETPRRAASILLQRHNDPAKRNPFHRDIL